MSEQREKLRAGIALLEAAATMLEQARNEFSGAMDDFVYRRINSAIDEARGAAMQATKLYDRAPE